MVWILTWAVTRIHSLWARDGERRLGSEPLPQRVEFRAELLRKSVAELIEELLGQRALIKPRLSIDREDLVKIFRHLFDPGEVQFSLRGQQADRGLATGDFSLKAPDSLVDYARVITEAWP